MLPLLLLLLVGAILMALRFAQLRRALLRACAGEAQFRLLAEHSRDPAFLLDGATLELLYLSPAAQRLTGLALPALQEHAARLAADMPARLQRWKDGDASRLTIVREVELAHRDGQLLALEITSTIVPDLAGRSITVAGSVRDVTQAQQEEAQRGLEQKRFASMLSHEFRTPLATIDGAVQRLVATGGADEATQKRYVKIQAAVDRLLGMIDDYLSPERMAAIGRERVADGIAPLVLLQQAAATVPASHPLQLQLDEDLPARLRCDVPGMALALKILLDNAVKFSAPGSPIQLEGRLAPQGGVEFIVLDRGAGVPPDEMARLFDKGYRGSHAAGHAGAGLGLYMARAVVEVHGGSLQVNNRADGGAAFCIWLPVSGAVGKSLASAEVSRDNSLT